MTRKEYWQWRLMVVTNLLVIRRMATQQMEESLKRIKERIR